MDLVLFFITLYGLVTDALGITTAAREVWADVRARADEGIEDARIWLGTKVSRPLAITMWMLAGGMILLTAFAGYINYHFVDAEAQSRGNFGLVAMVALGLAAASSIWAFFQYRWGKERFKTSKSGKPLVRAVMVTRADGTREKVGTVPVFHENYRPKKVTFVVSAAIAIISIFIFSLALSLQAVCVESRALWALSFVTRYFGLVLMAAIATLLSWVVRKGGGMLEKVLQAIVEPLAALAPGITMKNVHEKLFPLGLDLLDEEYWGEQIATAAVFVFSLMAPFDALLFLFPSTAAAKIIGAAYLIAVLTGMALRACGLSLVVVKSRDRLLTILFHYGKWIMVALVGGMLLIPETLRDGVNGQLSGFTGWLNGVLHGGQLIPEYGFIQTMVMLLIGAALLYGVLEGTKEWKSWVWKGLAIAGPSIFCLFFLASFMVYCGVWDGRLTRVPVKAVAAQPAEPPTTPAAPPVAPVDLPPAQVAAAPVVAPQLTPPSVPAAAPKPAVVHKVEKPEARDLAAEGKQIQRELQAALAGLD